MTFDEMIYHNNNLHRSYTFLESICILSNQRRREDEFIELAKIYLSSNRKRGKKLKINKQIWAKVRAYCLKIFDHKCAKCGVMPELKNLHVDHIKPKSIYPHLKYKIYNMQLLCKHCNFYKSNKNEHDYRIVKYTNNSMVNE